MSNTDELKATAVADSENIDALKGEEKEKLAAAEEAYQNKQTAGVNGSEPQDVRQNRRHERRGEKKLPWVPGVILIGLGLVFLFNNVTSFTIDNWWALFILIPAFGSFSKAADSLRSEGEFNRDAWGAMAGGIILTLVASAFLFNLDWSLIWPVFLIIGGLGLFFGGLKSW